MRPLTLFLLLSAYLLLPACGSPAPARRNIEVLYRFENLRRPADAKSTTVKDEWLPIRLILDRAATKPLTVTKSSVRTYGNLELANYEARAVIPTLDTFQSVQAQLEALATTGNRDQRVETTLSSLAALYKSNFILATANITVSGASVAGHHIRIYTGPGEPYVDATADSGGFWTAQLTIVPDTKWVYGLSEDPNDRVPTKYFRINLATRAQEPVPEAEFRKLFPPNAPIAPAGSKPSKSSAPSSSSLDQQRDADAERLRKQREAEDAAIQKRREAQDQSRPASPKP
jgi:hypothetical protein